MTPYYESDGVVIYHGDCRDILPAVKGEIAVTSPPYNTLGQSGGGIHKDKPITGENYKGYFDAMPEHEYWAWLDSVVCALRAAVTSTVWVNHKPKCRGELLHPLVESSELSRELWAEIVWSRPGGMALNAGRFVPSHETIYGIRKPSFWDDSYKTLFTVWQMSPDTGNKDHPCSFPVELPMNLIGATCSPGGTVIDPFMGSGTTLVAARRLCRRAIGIEKEERYCEIAVKRLDQGVLPLFADDPSNDAA